MNKLISKLIYFTFTIFIAVTAIFFIVRAAPGDPVENILGPTAKIDEIVKLKNQLGLDRTLSEQYFSYIKNLISFNLGTSIVGNKDIYELLKTRMSSSLILAFSSVSFAAFIGIILGIFSAIKKSTIIDNFIRFITLMALAFPIFSLAPVLVLIFSINLKWFPVSEWGSLRHMILPILTLTIPLSAVIARVSRNKYLEEKNAPWVVVLTAKGLSQFQIVMRILKVSLPTILTVISIQLSVVIAGTMITETIYDIPGMGTLLFDAISGRDYPVVSAVILYSTISYMTIYFMIDFINEYIDPRIDSGKK
jgi:peptide/nickel transport system permease protein